jgi:hypothetical protein
MVQGTVIGYYNRQKLLLYSMWGGEYIKMVKTAISYNGLSISEVPSEARNLGEGVARTRYTLLGGVAQILINNLTHKLLTKILSRNQFLGRNEPQMY